MYNILTIKFAITLTAVIDIEFECDERDSEIAKSAYHAPVTATHTWTEEPCRSTELDILDQVEDLEERVYQASIYTKVSSIIRIYLPLTAKIYALQNFLLQKPVKTNLY